MPSPCQWCSLPVANPSQQLCSACQLALPQLPLALCHYNLLWLPNIARGLTKPDFDQLLSLGLYQQPYQHWLQRWKFYADEAAGELLQQQFASLLSELGKTGISLPEAVVYVPMHPSRQRSRGFNQAQQLAQAAALELALPVLHVLDKTKRQPAQVGLNKKQRRHNLKNSFQLRPGVTLPAHLALVDDVVTTGATANEICRLLRRHGVKQISLWTVAVTAIA